MTGSLTVAAAAFEIAILAACGCSSQPAETPTVPIVSASPVPESVSATAEAAPSAVPRNPAPRAAGTAMLGGGCEVAKEAYLLHCKEEPADCARKGDEVSAGVYGAVLNRGSYLNACGTPATTAVGICAAVKDGRALAVTVTTDPPDPVLGRCVAIAVSALAFPSSPGLDITKTMFAAQ